MKRKQKPSTSSESSSGVITGGGKKSFTLLERASFFFGKMKRPLMLRIWLVLAVVVILIGGWQYFQNRQEGDKIVLKVGSYQYTQRQYDELISQAAEANVGKTTARQAIIASLAARAAADSLKLKYPTDQTSQDNAARAHYDLLLDSSVSKYQRATSWETIISPYVAVSELGGYKTAAVYFPFSRYITGFQTSYLTKTFDAKLVGNKDAVRQDIAYAKQRLNSSLDTYTKKTKTIDQIISAVLADPRLASYGQTANKSGIDLIGLDQQRYISNRSVLLRHVFYQNVEKSAGAAGKPEIFEDRISDVSHLNMPEIDRPGGETVVAYYFLVTESIAQRKDINSQYQQLSKEYLNGAL